MATGRVEIGECLNNAPETSDLAVEIVSCADEWERRILGNYTLGDAAQYPGDDYIDAKAQEQCDRRYRFIMSPSAETWLIGDRTLVCLQVSYGLSVTNPEKLDTLVNLGSIAGLYPMPAALYSASKGALHLLSQGLRMELKGSAVRCTEICPARVRTEFFDTAFDDPTKAAQAALGFALLEPSDIADAILYALDAPWRVNVSTIEITPTEQYIGGVYIEPVAR